jgi:hypothetical protein
VQLSRSDVRSPVLVSAHRISDAPPVSPVLVKRLGDTPARSGHRPQPGPERLLPSHPATHRPHTGDIGTASDANKAPRGTLTPTTVPLSLDPGAGAAAVGVHGAAAPGESPRVRPAPVIAVTAPPRPGFPAIRTS